MANQAAKKASKASSKASNLYLPIILAINAIYLAYRAIYHYATWNRWFLLWFLFTSGLQYLCYDGVVRAAADGLSPGYFFDLMIVAIVSQVCSIFSDRGWYVYLTVPAYGAFVLLQYLRARMAQSQIGTRTEEEIAQEEKRAAKKERKDKRQGRPNLEKTKY